MKLLKENKKAFDWDTDSIGCRKEWKKNLEKESSQNWWHSKILIGYKSEQV